MSLSDSTRTCSVVWRSDSYPIMDEVIVVHDQLIARFGGSPGIRDRGGLE
jgi:hypothetical protein